MLLKLLLWLDRLFTAPVGKEHLVGGAGLSPTDFEDSATVVNSTHPYHGFMGAPIMYFPKSGGTPCVGIVKELWTTGAQSVHSLLLHDYLSHYDIEIFGGFKLFSQKSLEQIMYMSAHSRIRAIYPHEPELLENIQEDPELWTVGEINERLEKTGFYNDAASYLKIADVRKT
jgi:hypothetical protein